MDFKTVFFNENGHLRSGLRFLIFLISFLILSALIIGGTVAVLINLPLGFSQQSLLGFVVPFILTSLIAMFLGWFYGKIFEDLPFRALGAGFTKNWFKDLCFGLIFGAFSIISAALIAYFFGGMAFAKNHSSGLMPVALTLLSTLVIFTFGAIAEELLFRGYMLQTLSRNKVFWIGMILTSFLFASAHNANPGANAFTWTNTFLAGIWLAVAYYKTRTLWFPFAVHFAWNWVQGAFLGINVSGLSELASAPLLRVTETGNSFVSGGDYGIEGGIACTVALIFSTALIYFSPFLKPTSEMLALTSEEIPKDLERLT